MSVACGQSQRMGPMLSWVRPSLLLNFSTVPWCRPTRPRQSSTAFPSPLVHVVVLGTVAKNNQERANLRRNFHQNAGEKHVWFSGYSFHIRGILSSYNGKIVKSRVYFSRGLILLLVRR